MTNKKQLTVSVITVCMNCEDTISDTIQNITSQDYEHIEYIVIDGKSKDKTIEIIEEHKDKINKFISEKDNGIYDAMNKGIGLSTGDYIIFMNAGDSFYNKSVITDIFKNIKKDYVLIMGDCVYKYPNNFKRVLKASIRIFELPTSHQSTFYKKEVFDKIGIYDTKYKIGADLDLWQKIYFKYKNNILIKNIPVSIYSLDGVSSSNWINLCKERFIISKKNLPFYLLIPNFLKLFIDVIKYVFLTFLKRIGIYSTFLKIKHKKIL